MLRTDIVLLKPTTEQESDLLRLSKETSLLWNQANYQRRQAFFKHQKIPTYNKQARTFKDNEHYKSIGAGNAQTLLKKLKESWKSFWELKMMLKQGRLPSHITKVSLPRYWKDRKTNQPVIKMWCLRNDYYKIRKNNTICISGTRHGRKPLTLKYAGTIREDKRLRLEVFYDKLSNRWYAHVRVEVNNKKRNHPTKKFGSIDLGICNIATLYVPDKRPLIYSGRAVLSDWVYYTKTIAKLQSLLGRSQRSSIRIQKIFRTRKRRFRHGIKCNATTFV